MIFLREKIKYALTGALAGAANGFFGAGGVLAGRIFGKLPTLWLRRAFALLLLYGGVRAVLLL